MAERRINWGPGDGTGKYRTEDTGSPGDFVVAEDTNGNTILLKWSSANGAWEYGGPVDMDGNDLIDAGTTVYDASADTVGDGTTSADHSAVTTGSIGITDFVDRASMTSGDQSISSGTSTVIQLDTSEKAEIGGWDLANNQWVAPSDGKYLVGSTVSWASTTSAGPFQTIIDVNGSEQPFQAKISLGSGDSCYQLTPPAIVDLTSGDSVSLRVFHNSGSTETVVAHSDNTAMEILGVA